MREVNGFLLQFDQFLTDKFQQLEGLFCERLTSLCRTPCLLMVQVLGFPWSVV